MAFDFPANPTNGQEFAVGTNVYTYNGTGWTLQGGTGSGGGGASVTIGDTVPANAMPGDLFWESDTGILWIRFQDVDSAQWVQVAGPYGVGGGGAINAADFVKKVGDIMTGNLEINASSAAIRLTKKAAGETSGLFGYKGNVQRWTLELGNGIGEAGSNAGSDFSLLRYSDTGEFLGTALNIKRSDATATFAGYLSAAYLATVSAANSGAVFFGNSGTKYLQFDGASFQFIGGPLYAPSFNVPNGTTIYPERIELGTPFTAQIAYIDFHSSGTNNDYDVRIQSTGGSGAPGSGNYAVSAALASFTGSMDVAGAITSHGYDGLRITVPGGNYARVYSTVSGVRSWAYGTLANGTFGISDESVPVGRMGIDLGGTFTFANNSLQSVGTVWAMGYTGRSGHAGAFVGVYNNMAYSGGNMLLYADNIYMGFIYTLGSDYRIKKDVQALPSMWDKVKALNPIKFTQAEFTPPAHETYYQEEVAKAAKQKASGVRIGDGGEAAVHIPIHPFVPADDVERWGFMAHELQETLVPSAASTNKDAPDAIQSVNPMVVVAALTKALQEAMVRIEALEAGTRKGK